MRWRHRLSRRHCDVIVVIVTSLLSCSYLGRHWLSRRLRRILRRLEKPPRGGALSPLSRPDVFLRHESTRSNPELLQYRYGHRWPGVTTRRPAVAHRYDVTAFNGCNYCVRSAHLPCNHYPTTSVERLCTGENKYTRVDRCFPYR